MDANIEKWKQELLRRGYKDKGFDPTIWWWNRKWFSIDGSDSSILQIWNGPIYTRVILSIFGTPEKPFAYVRYASVLHGEYPKTEWSEQPYQPLFLNAEEVWRFL